MGIDVWSTRPVASEQTEPAIQAESDKLKKISSAPATQKKPSAETPRAKTPKFTLAFFHYQEVAVCVSVNDMNGAVPRRLCDDMARYVGVDVAAVRFQQLEWPMLSTSGIDQSKQAARQVVTQKFSQLPERVIVLGKEVAEYYGPLEKLDGLEPMKIGKQSILLISEPRSLMTSSTLKKSLMLALSSWL